MTDLLADETVDAYTVLQAAFDSVVDEFDPFSADAVIDAVQSLEQLSNMVEARKADLMAEISRTGAHRHDGHGSAKTAVRHMGRLSNPTATARLKTVRMCSELALIRDAWRSGELGTDHVNLLGRVYSNLRIQPYMDDAQAWFLEQADECPSFDYFESTVRRWERLLDQDGPEPNQRNHEGRQFRLTQRKTDLGWDIAGSCASEQGASMHDLFQFYLSAETEADWAAARAEFGDAVCENDLPRTLQQRSADALEKIFNDAAGNGDTVPAGYTHNIVWDGDGYLEFASRFAGNDPQPLDPNTFRCETLSGISLDPTEAFANSLINRLRRVIVDAKGVVIDLGEARLFTGGSRHAVKLTSPTCVWPGCHAPVRNAEIDHMHDHASGGRTCPDNGAPLCGKHNRWKQKGFIVRRDATGTIHVHRADGSAIPN